MKDFDLGGRIASLRRAKGWTQEKLARALGVSNQAVSKWESNLCCPDVQLLPEITDLFGVTLDELFGRSAPEQGVPVESGLPWEDDGKLRAVLFAGRKCLRHQPVHETIRMEFRYTGPALDIESDFAVTVCEGSTVEGNVNAGDGVTCGEVRGSVTAGDGVRCGNVGGNVTAGDEVTCGDVGGSVMAGASASCQSAKGNILSSDWFPFDQRR
ncbi:MAG: helix-turn-helix domain-containing protein [Clostridiales bacterium]|nr:helix-turn-helix domain-containing protein [Clostridiales bacterium]